MQYVPFGKLGFDVSRLGMGCMRLPTMQKDGKTVIDREAAISMIRRGIDKGINYVDTAYGYHNGESEIVAGLALKDGYREKVTLTSKLPVWLVNEEKDMNRLLDEQLKKQASLLTSTEHTLGNLNTDKHTIDVEIKVVPKTVTDNMALSVKIGDSVADFTRSGNEFTAVVPVAMFMDYETRPMLYIGTGAGTQTEVLEDMADFPKIEPYYWEFVGLYKDVFVVYFYDEDNKKIYQCNAVGEAYCLTKGSPVWRIMVDVIPDEAVVVDRKFAESTEDNWNQSLDR